MAGTNGRREERWERGSQQYELSNHLGNVLVTISDRNYQIKDIISHQVPSPVAYYEADIVSASDYEIKIVVPNLSTPLEMDHQLQQEIHRLQYSRVQTHKLLNCRS